LPATNGRAFRYELIAAGYFARRGRCRQWLRRDRWRRTTPAFAASVLLASDAMWCSRVALAPIGGDSLFKSSGCTAGDAPLLRRAIADVDDTVARRSRICVLSTRP
jgi:hypothetical protein